MRFLASLLLVVATLPLVAQDPAVQGQTPTAAAVQARIDAVTGDKTIAPELKASLLEVLGKALEFARTAETITAATEALPTPKKIADELARARAEHEAAATVELPKSTDHYSLEEAEQALAKAQQDQLAAQKRIAELEKEATRRTTRRAEIPARLAELRKSLEALPKTVATENVDPRLLAARRLRLELERHRLGAEITALQAEPLSYTAREQLLSLRRDLAARKANNAKALASAWQAIVQERRSAAAAAAQSEAQRAADRARNAHPLIRQLAADNEKIASSLAALVTKQRSVESLIAKARKLQEDVHAQYQEIKKRAEGAGSTRTLGRMLRQGRAKLPDANRMFRLEGGPDEDEEAEAYLESLDWEQKRRQLADDRDLIDRLIETTTPPITDPYDRAAFRRRGQELLTHRLEMFTTLSDNASSYLASLQTLQAARNAVRELVRDYRTFVNERVLWIRSSEPIWRLDLAAMTAALSWLVLPQAWWASGRTMFAEAANEIWPLITMLLLVAVWLLRPVWRRKLEAARVAASNDYNTRYAPTALAVLWTVLLALPLPGLFLLASWLLEHGTDATGLSKAMAEGALQSAGFLAVLASLRQVVRRGGLGEAHFRWRPQTLAVLRDNLWLLAPAVFPLSMALGALEDHGDDTWLGSLGRLLLIPLLALLLLFLWRVLHPRTGILRGDRPRSLLGRMRGLWFMLGIGMSAALLGMTALGYEYTAIQLARSMIYTVAIVLGGALVHALILRKLLLERRRLLMQQARERRQARVAEARAAGARGDEPEEIPEEQFDLDPSSIAEQTHALVRTAVVLAVLFACLQVWSEVLPALGVFREVELWTDGSTEPPIKITLADLLTSLLIVLVTIVAARNIPGLLELLVLRRLRIQSGERHATTTLARYFLVAVGTVMAFSSIGLGWSKVQWLIAGVSLGLGFGLQEIFANFVSGLILLFERPVRVGDWVLVGEVLGKVTRIKIRATTVRDVDNKELVVPNKEFVTGRFVNWTLTDSFVRLIVPVGVAYGSDTDEAKRLLLQAADECPQVCKNPGPSALFLGFGDSALDLELRVYVEDYQEHSTLLDDLHSRVDGLFRANGIEIAFPQRDLHLRTAPPLVEFIAGPEQELERQAQPIDP